LPIVFDANVGARVETGPFLRGRTFSFEGQENQGGMADLGVVPLSLTWKWSDVNVNLSEIVFMPSGFYDPDEIVNLGKNYWSFDTVAGLTWLHPTRGHEISFNVGFMIAKWIHEFDVQNRFKGDIGMVSVALDF
jgi:hypothetical protein